MLLIPLQNPHDPSDWLFRTLRPFPFMWSDAAIATTDISLMSRAPGYRDGNRCRNDHLGLGKCSRTGAVLESGRTLGDRMRNGPASTCFASGGASFVTMVKSADLRDRDHSAQLRRCTFRG